jgi:hypothetical protein
MGFASSLPFSKPIAMADPIEIRTFSGKHVSVILSSPEIFGIYIVNSFGAYIYLSQLKEPSEAPQ